MVEDRAKESTNSKKRRDEQVMKEFENKVTKIQEDFSKFKKEILSKEEWERILEGLKERTKRAKDELDTLKNVAKEKFDTILNSLNEQINLEISVRENASETGEQEKESTKTEDGKKWLFRSIWDWFSDRRTSFNNKDKKEKWKTVWLLAVWGLATWGIFSYFSKEKREERRERRRQKKEAKRAAREERRKEIEALPFWDRPIWKILKWTLIWTVIVWWIYGLKKELEKIWENSIEWKLVKLRWLAVDSEVLKSQAENCLNLSHTYVIDYLKNKQEYDRILADALNLQTESIKFYDQISKSDASDVIKSDAEKIINNISKHVEDIESMKDEIYATVPEWDEWGDSWGWNASSREENPTEWGWSSDKEDSPEWEWNSSEFEPVSADVISQAAVDYINREVTAFSLDTSTKNKVKTTLNRYFTSYPLLKKGKDNKIVFEIGNKNEFWKMIKELWDNIVPQLWFIQRKAAQMFIGHKLDNIYKTMNDLDTKAYEDVVFDYFWWVVKQAVRKEWWSMTVQAYYDGISKVYPNRNASQVVEHIRSQANKDIKDLSYPFA